MEEIWRDIDGYPGYQISSLSRVRSISNPNKRSYKEGRVLKSHLDTKGYYRTCIYKNGKKVTLKNHRLVAQAWIPNPENKPWINHIDGDPKNNSIENLEWCTHQENVDHAWDTGLMEGFNFKTKGENHHKTDLKEEQVLDIRKLYSEGNSIKKICEIYNKSKDVIGKIVRGTTWKHLLTI